MTRRNCAGVLGFCLVLPVAWPGGVQASDGAWDVEELFSRRPAGFYRLLHSVDDEVCDAFSRTINEPQEIANVPERDRIYPSPGDMAPVPLKSLAAYLLKHENWMEPWDTGWHETSPTGGAARWEIIRVDIDNDGDADSLFRTLGRIRIIEHHILHVSERTIDDDQARALPYELYLSLRGHDPGKRDQNGFYMMQLTKAARAYRPEIPSSLYFYTVSRIRDKNFLVAVTSYSPINSRSELFVIGFSSPRDYQAVCHFASRFRIIEEAAGYSKTRYVFRPFD